LPIDMPPAKYGRVHEGNAWRRRRAALGRVAAAPLLVASLVLSGCPVTPVVRGGAAAEAPREPDPGPPEVLNPSLLDRG